MLDSYMFLSKKKVQIFTYTSRVHVFYLRGSRRGISLMQKREAL